MSSSKESTTVYAGLAGVDRRTRVNARKGKSFAEETLEGPKRSALLVMASSFVFHHLMFPQKRKVNSRPATHHADQAEADPAVPLPLAPGVLEFDSVPLLVQGVTTSIPGRGFKPSPFI